ncbi:MAG: choice-of-anchor D domain-containing protein [Planctomycetes bacterium]|nr:choice-of-anchor D domain-containing protein [Planctomycetota bacterium]
MRTTIIMLLACAGTLLAAQDYGDAPHPYPQKTAWSATTSEIILGSVVSSDTQNPVPGGWNADNDDGVVGSPLWNPVADDNQLTVRVGGGNTGYLTLWVDANDDGTWDVSERYRYTTIHVAPNADYTFTGIRLQRPQGFSRNGANKVAVRIEVQENFGGPPNLSPTGAFYFGEIEDWLIDCTAPAFTVHTLALREAVEGRPIHAPISAASGVPPYTWQLVSGSVPAGLTLVQSGNQFLLSGTPGAGTGSGSPLYSLQVQVTDATAQVAQRTLQLRVLAAPVAAPFMDDFSTNRGWVLGNTWSRAAAVAYLGLGVDYLGETCTEPATDATPTSTDNMILADSLGGPFTMNQLVPKTLWATSPIVDCSALASVQLRFKRWASTQIGDYTDGTDRLVIEASNDGLTWTNVWKSSSEAASGALVDMAWTLRVFDISAVAAGQPRVQVRFGVGPSIDKTLANPYIATVPDDFAGWCIDDLSIAAPPLDALQVSGFTLQSPMQFQHPDNQQTYPVGMRSYPHLFTALASNPTSQAVLLDSCEVGITWPQQPGHSHSATIAFHNGHQSWYDAGTWTLNAPVTLAAGQSGVTVMGTLQCNGLLPHLAYQVMRCRLYLRGTVIATGEPFESTAVMECVFDDSPSGLHVREANPGSAPGAEILWGETASGLRNFGSVPATVPATPGNWINIICQTNSSNVFTVQPPVLTGPDAGQFEIYSPIPWVDTPVQGLNNVWFSVRFRPTSLGAKSAWVEFSHTAINAPTPFRFEVIGTGVGTAPIVEVREQQTGGLVGNGATAFGQRDFGQVDISSWPTSPRHFIVNNVGSMALTLGTPVLTGPGAGAFVLDLSQFSTSIAPGAHATIGVSFNPAALGHFSAWVEFTHNDTGTANPFTFEVKGQGVITAPTIEVRLGGQFGPIVVPGTPAGGLTQFGALQVGGGPSGALTIYIRNLGVNALQVDAAMLTGTHAADFILTAPALPATLANGQSVTFDIAFEPRAKGPKSATIEFNHNDSAVAAPFSIAVAGFGTDAQGVTLMTGGVLVPGRLGSSYTMQFTAVGGTQPYMWAVASGVLPAGMVLGSDGKLSGTPTGSFGIFHFRVKVIDDLQGEDERQFELAIQPAPGTTSSGGSAGGGGCVAGASGGLAALALLLAAAAVRRRRSA